MTNTPVDRPVLNGRYELHRRIARGGMADVFLAKDQLLDRPVAVKVLFPQYAAEQAFVARFRREAQAAANLNHPSIVAVYDWGEHEDTYFIVMEYVEGRTLAEMIAQEGHLPADRAAEIAVDVAAALGFAHRNGTVHRDVKPGNIMINQAGQVKVADFGIARAFGGGDDELTQTGSVMGTASYFSPEQAQGKPVDPRSDLYSLGVVLYEMVVGEPPFNGHSPVAIAYKHVQEPAPRAIAANPAVPPTLDAVIDRLLRKNPAERYPAAEEVRADLRRFMEGQPLVGVDDPTAATPMNGAAAAAAPTIAGATAAGVLHGTDTTIAMPNPGAAAMPTRGRGDTGSSRAVIDTSRAVPASAAVRQEEPVEEYYEPPSRTGIFVIMLAILLAALVGLIVYISNTLEPSEDDVAAPTEILVRVPTVVNENVASAENDLVDAGFEVRRELVENQEVAPNIVFRQEPEAQAEVPQGSLVTLFVSKAAETERVPRLIGMTLEDAEALLADFGLRADITREFSDEFEENRVFDTSPGVDEEVNKGTRVMLFVSNGPEQVDIPPVAGETQVQATALMQAAGFIEIEFVTENSGSVEPGVVLRSDPPAGQRESVDSTIKIYVSSGPADVQIPGLIGLSREAAEQSLTSDELQLIPIFSEAPTDDPNLVGLVIGIAPAVGSTVKQGTEVQVQLGILQEDTTTTVADTTTTTEAPTTTVPPDQTTTTTAGGGG